MAEMVICQYGSTPHELNDECQWVVRPGIDGEFSPSGNPRTPAVPVLSLSPSGSRWRGLGSWLRGRYYRWRFKRAWRRDRGRPAVWLNRHG